VPFFGQGASQAILDAACLVNMLYDLPSTSAADISAIFERYVDQRSTPAKVASDSSREFADLIYDQGVKADIARSIVLRFTPTWLLRMITGTSTGARPILNFLPRPTGASGTF
jgi:2-polyprenyl-6-methoxyphenol hydroxylase-like FAD-dependent oxidoreductase